MSETTRETTTPDPPLAPEAAWSRLVPWLSPVGAIRLPRRDSAGRRLAEDLTATVDVPACDVSAMDGFILPREPVIGRAGEAWPVAGRVMAGDPPRGDDARLGSDETLRIMTGAPVPAGGERVIPVERARVETDPDDAARGERVTFDDSGVPGAHIRRRAEVLARGDELLPAGSLLTPGALALLATHGVDPVPVVGAPRVALVVTGDEVVPPETTPAPGQLRDSHGDFLAAAVADTGASFEHLGIAPDDPDTLAARLAAGLDGSDVLLVTGGVSAGEADLVEEHLDRLGCRRLVTAVAVQPGKPLVIAVRERPDGGPARVVFGLPGNPASVMVCFRLFVQPALRRLMGHDDGYLHGLLGGTLAAPLAGAKGRDRFLPARVDLENGRLWVEPVSPRGSHDLAAYARGTALVRIPAHAPPALPGDPCQVLPWRSGIGG
jgi:molybdopterin molybdotransferase